MAVETMGDKYSFGVADYFGELVDDRIRQAREEKGRPLVFTDRGAEHARAVVSRLIAQTRVSLDIVSGHLSFALYDPEFLRRCARTIPGKIRIILIDEPAGWINSIVPVLSSDIERCYILLRHLSEEKFKQPRRHFLISDRTTVRTRSSDDEKSAVVVLNADATGDGDSIAVQYTRYFESLWKISSEVKLTDFLTTAA